MTMKIMFLDRGREAECPPDPAYPNGMDIDLSGGASVCCLVELPYPAPRCGIMAVRCEKCDQLNMVTVAGRPDDPRSIRMACKRLDA